GGGGGSGRPAAPRGPPPRRGPPARVPTGRGFPASRAARPPTPTPPAVAGTLLAGRQTRVVPIPLEDAQPSDVVLVGRKDRRTPPVETMLAFFHSLDEVRSS